MLYRACEVQFDHISMGFEIFINTLPSTNYEHGLLVSSNLCILVCLVSILLFHSQSYCVHCNGTFLTCRTKIISRKKHDFQSLLFASKASTSSCRELNCKHRVKVWPKIICFLSLWWSLCSCLGLFLLTITAKKNISVQSVIQNIFYLRYQILFPHIPYDYNSTASIKHTLLQLVIIRLP